MVAVTMKTEGGRDILVETSGTIDHIAEATAAKDGIVAGGAETRIRQLEELGATIADVCRSLELKVRNVLADAKPDELTLEFGLKLAGEAGLPLVSKGSAEGTFLVTVKWVFSKPAQEAPPVDIPPTSGGQDAGSN